MAEKFLLRPRKSVMSSLGVAQICVLCCSSVHITCLCLSGFFPDRASTRNISCHFFSSVLEREKKKRRRVRSKQLLFPPPPFHKSTPLPAVEVPPKTKNPFPPPPSLFELWAAPSAPSKLQSQPPFDFPLPPPPAQSYNQLAEEEERYGEQRSDPQRGRRGGGEKGIFCSSKKPYRFREGEKGIFGASPFPQRWHLPLPHQNPFPLFSLPSVSHPLCMTV